MDFDKNFLSLQSQKAREFSSAGSEHLPYKQRVGGSNPSTPTREIKSMTKPLNRVAFVVSVWVWEFTHKYPQIRQKYRTKYGFVIDFISEGTDGSQRNNRRRRCAAILLPTEQTNKKRKPWLAF